jgi:hypothetical protein
MAFEYPTNDFDRVGQLMGMVGSFWNNVFSQRSFVLDTVFAKGQLEQQTLQQMCELFDGVSRLKIPVFHKERWYSLKLLESDRNTGKAAQLLYNGEADYDAAGPYKYGVPRQLERFAWDAPTDLKDVKVITNRLHDAGRTLTLGVDFLLEQDSLIFQKDPFLDDFIVKRDVVVDGEITDREIALWAFHGDFDFQYLFEQFGYVLQLALESGQGYKDLINSTFDALVEGTTQQSVEQFFESLTGTKLVVNATETVEEVRTEVGRKLVITDKAVYPFSPNATVLVSEGDEVTEGQSLADTLQFFEFNRGQCPSAADCPAVVLGRGFLGPGFFGDLVFENESKAMVVTTDDEGFTRLSWELGGFPGDVTKFFDDLHTRGVAAGETLANLLDTRTNKVGEPGASNLPATINPMEFLCENIFRNNAYMVKIQSGSFGPDAVGMNAGKILRKVHPPQTAIIIVAQLAYKDDDIIMEDPGTDTAPGYEEVATVYSGMSQSETIGIDMLSECVKVKLIGGRCV